MISSAFYPKKEPSLCRVASATVIALLGWVRSIMIGYHCMNFTQCNDSFPIVLSTLQDIMIEDRISMKSQWTKSRTVGTVEALLKTAMVTVTSMRTTGKSIDVRSCKPMSTDSPLNLGTGAGGGLMRDLPLLVLCIYCFSFFFLFSFFVMLHQPC